MMGGGTELWVMLWLRLWSFALLGLFLFLILKGGNLGGGWELRK